MSIKLSTLSFALAAVVALGTPGLAPAQQKDEHGHAAEGHGHGEKSDLGTTTVAGVKLSVAQMGEVKEGGSAVFEVLLDKSQAKPKNLRLWVGNTSAEGSVKARAQSTTEEYDVHVEVPKKLTAESQLWVELEPATGKREKTSFDLKR